MENLFETIAENGLSHMGLAEWLFVIGALLIGIVVPTVVILKVFLDAFTSKEAKFIKKLRKYDDPAKLPRKPDLLHNVLSMSNRKKYELSRHEVFMCLKRLEQLKHLDRSEKRDLAELYVDHFEDTDRSVEGALRSTKAVSDDGNPWGTLQYAIMLYKYNCLKEALAQFRKLAKLDSDPQLPMLINETQGPEAAWYIAQIIMQVDGENNIDHHAYNLILRAALGGYSKAIDYYEHPGEKLKKQQGFAILDSLVAQTEDEEKRLKAGLHGMIYGEKNSLYLAGVHYYDLSQASPSAAKRAFLLLRLAYHMGHIDSAFPLGVLYSNGRGTDRNYTQAYYCFKDTIEHNTQNAIASMYNLGVNAKNQEKNQESIPWYKLCLQTIADKMNWELDALENEDPTWNADRWHREASAALNTYMDIQAHE